MNTNLATANSAAPSNETLRSWTKPEAKAAEVAKATLGVGGNNSNPQDMAACAS